MPELPEVETIKRGLEKKIIGLKIKKVDVLNAKSFLGQPSQIEGATITNIWRRAKVLGVDVQMPPLYRRHPGKPAHPGSDSGRAALARMTLLIHLKMSGQLILTTDDQRFVGGHPTDDWLDQMPNRSTRVILTLSCHPEASSEGSDSTLYFNDQRKFGWIKLVDSRHLAEDSLLAKLGPEPLEKDFTWQILKQNLLRHKTLPTKVALLDQTAVAGIGNIYANEACFIAKIRPTKKVSTLTDQDFQNLHRGIIQSLTTSIEKGGSSRRHYRNIAGQKGEFLDFAFVYNRHKLPCKVCSTPIAKITLAGRGTYYCPLCQI